MSKIAHYLQEHLDGEVTDSVEVRRYFSHDASILELAPSVVVYPASESDIRKTARFCWQLAERGQILPITARGGGTDTSGAAIGNGIMLAMTGHLNRILELDLKKRQVTVEPGITFGTLHQTLVTHGLFLPPVPVPAAYATIGGGLANNSLGEKSVKYGAMLRHVERLSVVLANGEIIDTGPLNKRELNRKLGLSSLEGEIYRTIDSLIEENQELISTEGRQITALHNRVGYNIFDVKTSKDFDLTPLFLGSQGSLGVITEATLRLAPHNPVTDWAVVSLEDINSLHDILPRLLKLKPSACEMINKEAVQYITRFNPALLKGVIDHPAAALHLIVEFDDSKEASRKKCLKSLQKLSEKAGGHFQSARTAEERQRVEKLKQSTSSIFWAIRGNAKAVPVAEDVSVPLDRLADFIRQAAQIYTSLELPPVMWGHAGVGVIRMSPMIDLSQVGGRQKLFKLSDSIYKTAASVGGSITGSVGDGRLRAPYAGHVYGPQMHQLMMRVKKAFDPHGILNRGVKTASAEEVRGLIRDNYSHSKHEHLL
ncbi:MAG TPA: FAD-binding oxidoreductase [Candidatus Saccharimonadales bacterium]|nr:FAD-binding oxidoreductase [Candidatus Saccharimonadales bacterium]